MTTLVRKKPCRHCLFTKNALGKPDNIKGSRIAVGMSRLPFRCHEHSERTVCCMDFRQRPELVEGPVEFTNRNGDRKSVFAHLPKAEQEKFSYGGKDYSESIFSDPSP